MKSLPRAFGNSPPGDGGGGAKETAPIPHKASGLALKRARRSGLETAGSLGSKKGRFVLGVV
jgi:hypothetical protein